MKAARRTAVRTYKPGSVNRLGSNNSNDFRVFLDNFFPELLDILVPKESARFFELPCFHAKLNEKVNSSSAIKFVCDRISKLHCLSTQPRIMISFGLQHLRIYTAVFFGISNDFRAYSRDQT